MRAKPRWTSTNESGELCLKPEVLLQQGEEEDGEDGVLELELLIPQLLVGHKVEQRAVFPLLRVQILRDLPILIHNVVFHVGTLEQFFILQEEVDILQRDGSVGQEHAATSNVLPVSGLNKHL